MTVFYKVKTAIHKLGSYPVPGSANFLDLRIDLGAGICDIANARSL